MGSELVLQIGLINEWLQYVLINDAEASAVYVSSDGKRWKRVPLEL